MLLYTLMPVILVALGAASGIGLYRMWFKQRGRFGYAVATVIGGAFSLLTMMLFVVLWVMTFFEEKE